MRGVVVPEAVPDTLEEGEISPKPGERPRGVVTVRRSFLTVRLSGRREFPLN